MMMLIVTLVYLCFIIPDFISMFKEKEYLLIWLYSSIIIITYTLSVLIYLDVKIPSPQPLIQRVVKSIIGSPTVP